MSKLTVKLIGENGVGKTLLMEKIIKAINELPLEFSIVERHQIPGEESVVMIRSDEEYEK